MSLIHSRKSLSKAAGNDDARMLSIWRTAVSSLVEMERLMVDNGIISHSQRRVLSQSERRKIVRQVAREKREY